MIIVLHILDFFKLLPGDIDYLKKIISLAIIGYLLYITNISNVIFGVSRKKYLNIFIILSFFMFFFKDLVAFGYVIQDEVNLFKAFIDFIVANAAILEVLFFYIGGISLLLITLYITIKVDIEKPSFMAIIHEEGIAPRTLHGFVERYASVFFVLIMFFLFVFNLMVEWLALVIDSPIIIFGLLFYVFIIIRYHKHFSVDNFIYKLGQYGETLYRDFISLFHYRSTVFLGISGLLILHLLTDLVIFVIPFFTGISNIAYYGETTQISFLALFLKDLAVSSGLLNIISLIGMYILNILAIIFLAVIPPLLWYRLYKKKGLDVHHFPLAIFFFSITAFLLRPLLSISRLNAEQIAGVDFISTSVLSGGSLVSVFLISLAVGLIVLFLSYLSAIKRFIIALAVIIVDLAFGYYVYLFFIDVFKFYVKLFMFLVQVVNEYFIAAFFLIFMTFTVIFYVFGYIVFLIETYQEYKVVK